MTAERVVESSSQVETKPFPGHGIYGLRARLSALEGKDREMADGIIEVENEWAETDPPPPMYSWLTNQFGSVEKVLVQPTVRVRVELISHAARFNEIRAKRPNGSGGLIDETRRREKDEIIEEIIAQELKNDVFANPLEMTPKDKWGRIRGKYCVSAANAFKISPGHSLVIFDEPHPLKFSRPQVKDYLETADKVWKLHHLYDSKRVYPYLFWNCFSKAGASQIHGHLQLEMGSFKHEMEIDALRKSAIFYKEKTGESFWIDYARLHEKLGLVIRRNGNTIMAHVVPTKENEIWMFGQKFDEEFASEVYDLLDVYKNRLGVRSFTLSIAKRPIVETGENWSEFPEVLLRLVDRGDPTNRTADWGGMEMYAAESVVSSDPYTVKRVLSEHWGESS